MQNPIQGGSTNTIAELNFNFLTYEIIIQSGTTNEIIQSDATNPETNPNTSVPQLESDHTHAEPESQVEPHVELEMESEELHLGDKIIQYDNPYHSDLILLSKILRLVLLNIHLNYHQEKIGEIYQNGMYQ